MNTTPPNPSAVEQILNPTAFASYKFGFADFLKREYHFGVDSDRPICKAYQQGHCPLGEQCPDKHEHRSNYNNLVCKHWLRGLCKKGDSCEFLHEYNLRMMPECTQYSRHLTCTNGIDCLYLHLDPVQKQPPCLHYERGFCPLGPRCAARHIKRKLFCRFYLAGFCPNGRECEEGGHPSWREKEDLKKPEVKKILTAEEQEMEKERIIATLERQREEERRDFEERGHVGRQGRGRGGRKSWTNNNNSRGRRERY